MGIDTEERPESETEGCRLSTSSRSRDSSLSSDGMVGRVDVSQIAWIRGMHLKISSDESHW